MKLTEQPQAEVAIKCRGCSAMLSVSATEAATSIACGRCGTTTSLQFSDAVREDRDVDVCPVCRGRDFYGRKDFNPRKGLAVIICAAMISAVFYYFGQDLVAYGILAAAALIDLLIYGRLGEVTVCYRCHTEFRGTSQPSAPAFDLHTADVLEHEYRRTLQK